MPEASYTIDPIRTVQDLRDAERKMLSLFTMCEACAELEAGYRAEGKTALADLAAERGERFSDWAEDLSDAMVAARRRNGWGPY
jgi:hypothetical protein